MNKLMQQRNWEGFSASFWDDVVGVSTHDSTTQRLAALDKYTFSGQKQYPFGLPVMVRNWHAKRLEVFYACYVQLLDIIIAQYRQNETLRRYVALPDPLRDIAARAPVSGDQIDLCRLDFFLEPSGGFMLLETNANCPGGLIYSGIAAGIWREIIPDRDVAIPTLYENPTWMADWFLEKYGKEASANGFVPIFRENGGHALELSTHREQFLDRAIDCELVDPRGLVAKDGSLFWQQRQVHAGYQKIGVPEFCRMSADMNDYVEGLLSGTIKIQNGMLGRWVGDNKLCLAVLSDPRFEALFPDHLLAQVRPHIPWSRNVAWCTADELDAIRQNRRKYVLKRPLDTRGRGVVIGRDIADEAEWNQHVDNSIQQEWLCMEYVPTTQIQRHDLNGEFVRHDLAVSALGGRLIGGYVRSSKDERVNVALNGRLHPLFFEAGEEDL